MTRTTAWIAGLGLWLLAGNAWGLELGGVLHLSAETGGERFMDTNRGAVEAGGQYHAAAGLRVRGQQLETRLTYGLKTDKAAGDNGAVTFDRWPMELLQFYYPTPGYRFGVGATYHHRPELNCDLESHCDWTQAFEDALGYVVQADVLPFLASDTLADSMSIGVRYTSITYSPEAGGRPLDGGALGVTYSAWF